MLETIREYAQERLAGSGEETLGEMSPACFPWTICGGDQELRVGDLRRQRVGAAAAGFCLARMADLRVMIGPQSTAHFPEASVHAN
jgi:hypothetical protein